MVASTQQRQRQREGGPAAAAAKYQLASDGYDGVARSGVIREDGRWVPAEAGNPDWYEYMQWLRENEDNRPAPFASPRDGGFTIRLDPNQSAVGSMKDSIDDDEMPKPPEEPRRLPHQADLYNPPAVPTDHSHSPGRDQRGDAYRPLTAAERQMRDTRLEWNRAHPAEIEGVWTQEQADNRRHFHENAQREREEMLRKAQAGQQEQNAEQDQLRDKVRELEREEALRRQPTTQAAEEMPSPAPEEAPAGAPAGAPPHTTRMPPRPPGSGGPTPPTPPTPPPHTPPAPPPNQQHDADKDDAANKKK